MEENKPQHFKLSGPKPQVRKARIRLIDGHEYDYADFVAEQLIKQGKAKFIRWIAPKT